MNRLKRLSLYLFLGLLAYMPLHIFLSTWAGTSLNILEFMKVAKDGILLIGFLLALAASITQPWFKTLLRNKLIWLIVAYGVLTTLLALIKPTDQDAEILGVVYNTRFLLFFVYGLLLTKLFDAEHVRKRALQVVLAAATVVLFFGVVQYTVLPDDALKSVGYERANGVLPAFFIDEKPDLERIMSTLRDPNSFGSYIIVVGSLAAAIYLASRNRGEKLSMQGLLLLGLLCLIFTFSRSAWLGAVLAMMTILITSRTVHQFIRKHKKKFVGAAFALICIVSVGLAASWNSYLVKNVIFHADEATVLEDPNELRTRFFRESVDAIADEPLGHGPGTAGLASIRNDKQGVVLNENYYLQIGYEVGIIGLVLFLAILMIVGSGLLTLGSPLALGLFAGLVGLMLTNFLVHIWSSEAVAYTWWGLAGVIFLAVPKRASKPVARKML